MSMYKEESYISYLYYKWDDNEIVLVLAPVIPPSTGSTSPVHHAPATIRRFVLISLYTRVQHTAKNSVKKDREILSLPALFYLIWWSLWHTYFKRFGPPLLFVLGLLLKMRKRSNRLSYDQSLFMQVLPLISAMIINLAWSCWYGSLFEASPTVVMLMNKKWW